MKRILMGVGLGLFALAASAGDTSISRNTNLPTKISVEEMRARFEVRGDIFVLDAAGKVLQAEGGESRIWMLGKGQKRIESNWASSSNLSRPLVLRQAWEIEDDGRIKYTITQFERMEGKHVASKSPDFRNPVKTQEGYLDNFDVISFKSAVDTERMVIVRLVPGLQPKQRVQEMGTYPVVGTDMILVDNKGYRWLDRVDVEARYVSFETHRGSIALSFSPFAGARKIGEVSGSRIELDPESGLHLSLVSRTPFLPGAIRAPVYGLYNAGKKSNSPNSTGTSTTDDEKDFLARIR